jgi:hypothetical protein
MLTDSKNVIPSREPFHHIEFFIPSSSSLSRGPKKFDPGTLQRRTPIVAQLSLPASGSSRITKVFSTNRSRFFVWGARMLTSVFDRIRFLMLAIALAVSTWSVSEAAGSFQTRPAFPSVAGANDSPHPPTLTRPGPSARALFGGCGKGRVSDAQTHDCRGPADIRGTAP